MAATVTDSVAIGSATAASTVETGSSLTPTGSNKRIYVLVGSGANTPSDPTSVKYASAAGVGGEALTLLDSVRTLNVNIKTSVWELASPVAASGTIWAQLAGTDDEQWIIGVAVQDAGGTATVAYATANTNANPSVNATTTAGELVLAFLSVLNTSAATPLVTAGQTSIKELEGPTAGPTGIDIFAAAGAESTVSAGASTTMTWTINNGSSDWGLHAFQVNSAGGGGGGNNAIAWITA